VPHLGGTLRLSLDYQPTLPTLPLRLFQWDTPLAPDNRFDAVVWSMPLGYTWNIDNLYIDGTIKLEAAPITAPEPGSLTLLMFGAASVGLRPRRRRSLCIARGG
jgi:hypothetical protein